MAVLQMKRINICGIEKRPQTGTELLRGAVRLKWIRFCPRTVCFPALILPPTVLFFKKTSPLPRLRWRFWANTRRRKNPCSPR